MVRYEYKVVPAPHKGEKAKGLKGPEMRFAYALEHVMNDMASDGWEFLRSETLPSEERSGLTQTTTHWRTMLVFRREVEGESEVVALPAPFKHTATENDEKPVPFLRSPQPSAEVTSLEEAKHARSENDDD